MSPGSEGCLRGPAGFDTIHPQSPVVTGEVCAPTNLVFRGPENPVSAPADRARVGRRADENYKSY